MLTCKNGKVTRERVLCDPITTKPQCDNGLDPVKVYYNNGCCYKYECECEFKSYCFFVSLFFDILFILISNVQSKFVFYFGSALYLTIV